MVVGVLTLKVLQGLILSENHVWTRSFSSSRDRLMRRRRKGNAEMAVESRIDSYAAILKIRSTRM